MTMTANIPETFLGIGYSSRRAQRETIAKGRSMPRSKQIEASIRHTVGRSDTALSGGGYRSSRSVAALIER